MVFRNPTRQLPDNKDPVGTRCIQITIPDDDDWERSLYGEVYRLTRWYLWDRDSGKNAKPVADRWLEALSTWSHCKQTPCPPNLSGEIEDFEMPLRVDCDCNVFVTCCDGTEKQILTKDQVQQLVLGQPGSAPPVAPGGCADYQVRVHAGGAWLLPTLVNTGDVLTPTNLDGASTDVAPIGRWNCPSGLQFVGGTCTGDEAFDPSAPRPDLPIGIPLLQVGSNYYDLRTPITIGSSVVNAPAAAILNYNTGGDYAGDVTFALNYCNNTVGTFTHTFDFTRGTEGWSLKPGYAELLGGWVPGQGWTCQDTAGLVNTFYRRVLAIHITFPSTYITSLIATFTNQQGIDALGSERSQYALFNNAYYQWNRDMAHAVDGVDQIDVAPLPNPGTSEFELGLQTDTDPTSEAGFTGHGWISRVVVTGIGADPF